MTNSEPGLRVVSRADLYEQVWRTPATKLAAEYGVSNVAIIKACKRHEIPRPPRGYWAMIQHGYKVEQPPLPAASDPRLNQVRFFPEPARPSRARHAQAAGTEHDGTAIELPAVAPIPVADRLTSPHPLVEIARQQLRDAKADADGLLHTDPKTAPSLAVARNSITRALCILDALFKAWESGGGEIKIDRPSNSLNADTHCVLGRGRDVMTFSLTERTEALPEPDRPKSGYYRRYPPRRPTGHLAFKIEGYWNDRTRRTWSDGQRQRLEDVLPVLRDGLETQVEHLRLDRLDNECEGRQRRRAEERRATAEALAKQRKEKVERLLSDVDAWDQAERIRKYVAAIRRSVRNRTMRIRDGSRYRDYLAWASHYADQIDPVVAAAPRRDAPQPPVNTLVAELDLTRRGRAAVVALGIADTNQLHGVTKARVQQVCKDRAWSVWSELTLTLEGLGYNVSDRGPAY